MSLTTRLADGRSRTWRLAAVAFLLVPGLTGSTGMQDLPPQALVIYGGGGGSAFTRTCGSNRVMTGFQYRKGLVIDGIGLLCRPVQSNGTLGSESAGSMAGGGGGSFGTRSCAAGSVVVGGVVEYGSVIETVRIRCREWKAATRSYGTTEVVVSLVGNNATLSIGRTKCDNATQPVVSIRGRAGLVVDAVGFTCDEP